MASGARRSQFKDQESSDEEQGSQDMSTELLEVSRNIMAAVKKRRETKRKAIQDEHLKRTKDLAARIDTLFENRKNRVSKLQKAQWDKLDALNKRRVALEAQIIASMRSIEQQTANIRSELSAVFDGRKEDTLETQMTQLD